MKLLLVRVFSHVAYSSFNVGMFFPVLGLKQVRRVVFWGSSSGLVGWLVRDVFVLSWLSSATTVEEGTRKEPNISWQIFLLQFPLGFKLLQRGWNSTSTFNRFLFGCSCFLDIWYEWENNSNNCSRHYWVGGNTLDWNWYNITFTLIWWSANRKCSNWYMKYSDGKI